MIQEAKTFYLFSLFCKEYPFLFCFILRYWISFQLVFYEEWNYIWMQMLLAQLKKFYIKTFLHCYQWIVKEGSRNL